MIDAVSIFKVFLSYINKGWKMQVRVNFLGIPYSGKSYCSVYLLHKLRDADFTAEYIEEPFKDLYYRGYPKPDFYIEGREFFDCVTKELGRLQRGVDILINDSGLWTILYYLNDLNVHKYTLSTFIEISKKLDSEYKTYNVLVQPLVNIKHSFEVGRWYTDINARQGMAADFKRFLDKTGVQYETLSVASRKKKLDTLSADIITHLKTLQRGGA